MSIDLDDLIGLNMTTVHDMPVIGHASVAKALLDQARTEADAPRLVAAGMRHSQGGHTALSGGRVLVMEALNTVTYDTATQTFTAEAGATWAQIHHTLLAHGRAPLVHQSSGHFTVGGSLAANCHGRDPSQGPIGNTVMSMDVLCGDGVERTATPDNAHQGLFSAVVGGYGCCGLILRATFRTTANPCLQEIWGVENEAKNYIKVLEVLPLRKGTDGHSTLHYGWLCCLDGKDFLNEVVYADYVENAGGAYTLALKDEAWGTSEVLRASWSAATQDAKFQQALWNEIKGLRFNPSHASMHHRMNWMRAAVSFTASRGDPGGPRPDRVEMLQEYFVPVGQCLAMLAAMRTHLAPGNAAGIRLLTCTVRVVQPDAHHTALSYAPDVRVCLALEASVPLVGKDHARAPTAEAANVFRALIDAVLGLGGTYYLPYYPFATSAQFHAAYPHARATLQAAADTYDPQRVFSNTFLTFVGV